MICEKMNLLGYLLVSASRKFFIVPNTLEKVL